MAAFGRSSSSAKKGKAKPAAHDFTVKSVPRKVRNAGTAGAAAAASDEVCEKEPEEILVIPPAAETIVGEIGLGDVESLLKDLEVSETSFGESTSDMIASSCACCDCGKKSISMEISTARSARSWCRRDAVCLLLTVMATIASMTLALLLKVKLEGLDMGPMPT